MGMPSTVFLSPMLTGSRELKILSDDRKKKKTEGACVPGSQCGGSLPLIGTNPQWIVIVVRNKNGLSK